MTELNKPIKVNSKIISHKILSDLETLPSTKISSSVELMHESIIRPDHMPGLTYKIKNPLWEHALYITINDIILNEGTPYEERRPYEMFINSKNMEQFQWILALTRLVSAVFRKGGEYEFVVDELKAVFDPSGGYWKKGGVFCPSIVADIGLSLEAHINYIKQINKDNK